LLYKYIINGIAASVVSVFSRRGFLASLPFIAVCLLAVWATSLIGTVQEAQEAFEVRWHEANEIESQGEGALEALRQRTQSGTLDEIKRAFDQPVLGHGIGLGTNVGAMRVSGFQDFLVSEGAWGNLIGELGPLLGGAALFVRLALAWLMLNLALRELRRDNPLPMLLSGLAVVGMVIGTTSQPTSLGFIVICSGVMLAACNPSREGFQWFPLGGAPESPEELHTAVKAREMIGPQV
jgi:hypothetical protein